MTAANRTEVRAIPGFGTVLMRSRLLSILSERVESTVLLSAPGGYGKSVLAAELATEPTFGKHFWIDATETDSDFESLVLALDAVGGDDSPADCIDGETESFRSHVDHSPVETAPVCVVLDNLQMPISAELCRFAEYIRRATSECSLLIVTTRSRVSAFDDGRMFTVPTSCLKLDESEAAAIINLYSDAGWSARDRTQLADASGGHPALLCVLVRQASLVGLNEALSTVASCDVLDHLRRLADEQLTENERWVLRAMALLGRGNMEQLARVVGRSDCAVSAERISSAVPLVHVDKSRRSFLVHDLAIGAYAVASETSSERADLFAEYVERACAVMDSEGRYDHLLRLAITHSTAEELVRWAELHGAALLASGSVGLVRDTVDAVGLPLMLSSPRLLLIQAELLRQTADSEEALRKSAVARDIACHDGDSSAEFDALLLMGRMQVDMGAMSEAVLSLEAALSLRSEDTRADGLVLAEALLALSLTFLGQWREADSHAERAAAMMTQFTLPADLRAQATMAISAIIAVLRGRWDVVLRMYLELKECSGVSTLHKLQCRGNLGAILAEIGRLGRARAVLSEVLADCRERGLHTLEMSYLDSLGVVEAGDGHYSHADELAVRAVQFFEAAGDNMEVARILVYRSAWSRASSSPSRSLELAEAALEYPSGIHCQWLNWSASLEIAASLLALGDSEAAAQQAAELREASQSAGAERHWLVADMILAEAARRDGQPEEGIARLLEHEEYVATESSNWQIAMYIRSFPHLLGMFAAALGAENLPAHLLRMVLPSDVNSALAAAAEILDEDAWRQLAGRLVGEGDLELLDKRLTTPTCEVRLFGGLQVRVGDREITDRAWRKRKARLLFAMLVLNHGREMPREQVFEYLWAEMDGERARNNFYVIWSAMKNALSPGSDKTTPCPYIENSGGMCRIVRGLVESDVDRFEALVAESHDAEAAGDSGRAIAALLELAEVYSGELLPGDVYDDWFSHSRDTYRMEFGDAMLRCSRLLQAEDEPTRALSMVRRALTADPWREDLYQAALALQIECGQRSAAIETYTMCRRRLADDLGLDPSSETMKLYEQILAMEEEPDADR